MLVTPVRFNKSFCAHAKPANVYKKKELQQTLMPPAFLICPITLKLFVDPWIDCYGYTYEKAAIISWMRTSDRCPMTNVKYPPGAMSKRIFQNRALKNAVEHHLRTSPDSSEEETTDDDDLEMTSWMKFNTETQTWECQQFNPEGRIRIGNTGRTFSSPVTPTPQNTPQ